MSIQMDIVSQRSQFSHHPRPTLLENFALSHSHPLSLPYFNIKNFLNSTSSHHQSQPYPNPSLHPYPTLVLNPLLSPLTPTDISLPSPSPFSISFFDLTSPPIKINQKYPSLHHHQRHPLPLYDPHLTPSNGGGGHPPFLLHHHIF